MARPFPCGIQASRSLADLTCSHSGSVISGAIRGSPDRVYASSGIMRPIPPLNVCWTSDPHDPGRKTLTQASLISRQGVGHHPNYTFTYVLERSRGAGSRSPTHHRRRLQDALAPVCSGCRHRRGIPTAGTRHSVGTRYVRVTCNLKGAQRLLGHARIETATRNVYVLLRISVSGTGRSNEVARGGWSRDDA